MQWTQHSTAFLFNELSAQTQYIPKFVFIPYDLKTF